MTDAALVGDSPDSLWLMLIWMGFSFTGWVSHQSIFIYFHFIRPLGHISMWSILHINNKKFFFNADYYLIKGRFAGFGKSVGRQRVRRSSRNNHELNWVMHKSSSMGRIAGMLGESWSDECTEHREKYTPGSAVIQYRWDRWGYVQGRVGGGAPTRVNEEVRNLRK